MSKAIENLVLIQVAQQNAFAILSERSHVCHWCLYNVCKFVHLLQCLADKEQILDTVMFN